MLRNKIVLSLLVLAIGLTIYGFANDSFTSQDAIEVEQKDTSLPNTFYVHARNGKSVSPSTLKNATSIADIVEYYPSSWITNYDSVVVHTTSNGRQQSAMSKDATLTPKQRELLSTADMFTDVVIYVKHKTTNSITHEKEDEDMSIKLYVRPETEAQYPNGIEGVQDYLRENCKDEVALLDAKMGFLAIAYFTIDEDGRPESIKISEVEEYKGIDEVLRNAVQQMPTWTPAKDLEGNAVKQKFEFVFGFGNEGGGC